MIHPNSEPGPRLLHARAAICTVFFLLGAGFGLWAVHIPILQARLRIDPAAIGAALLVMAMGAIVAMPLSGWAVARQGSKRPTAVLAIVFAALLPFPILAGSLPWLFTTVLFFGAALGGLDVAMNTQAAELETARGRPTMSSIHAFYSLGGLAGAAMGGLLIARGWTQGGGLIAIATGFVVIAALTAPHLWQNARPVESGPRFVLPTRAAAGVGLLTFLAFAAEGAIGDWSALFLLSEKQASPATAATGFAAFSVAMAAVRLVGDPIVARLGRTRTLAGGGALMAAGTLVAIALPHPLPAALGFALVGIGAANIVPVLFTASARIPGMSPHAGIAACVTMGYAGFVIMPPILGFVGAAWGLTSSMVLVGVMGAIIAVAAPATNR